MTVRLETTSEHIARDMQEGRFPQRSEPQTVDTLTTEFKQCLSTMSHSRAGWDYELPPAQRAEENRQEREALARARSIWSENPERHDDLRAAFKETGPLATMTEIERA